MQNKNNNCHRAIYPTFLFPALLAAISQNRAMTPALLKKVAKELSVKDGIVSTSLPTFYQSDTTDKAIKKE